MTRPGQESALLFIVGLVLVFPALAWWGFVGSRLWSWFVVSTFGLHPITTWQAAGLFIVAGHFWYHMPQRSEEQTTTYLVAEKIAVAFLPPLFMLALGTVVREFA